MCNLNSITKNDDDKWISTHEQLYLTGVGKLLAIIDKLRDTPTGCSYPFVALLSRINGHNPVV